MVNPEQRAILRIYIPQNQATQWPLLGVLLLLLGAEKFQPAPAS